MSIGGYEAFEDPYCYKGTTVLKNRLRTRHPIVLEAYELEMSSLRADDPLPTGQFGPAHYRAVHRHLFQDVYTWAGKYRKVRIGKDGNWFCYPEYIKGEMARLFARLRASNVLSDRPFAGFCRAGATFLGELNAIHPFRDGNGRSQLNLTRIRPNNLMRAMVESFSGNTAQLTRQLASLRVK